MKPIDPQEREDAPSHRILVAEDNPDSRDALKGLLEAYGYVVLEARDGAEAVKQAMLTRPDLVLMDIMMPGMDGLQATRKLRAEQEFQQLPIIALTAMAGSRDMALSAGCDDYLAKPIDVPLFLQTIRNLIAERRGTGA